MLIYYSGLNISTQHGLFPSLLWFERVLLPCSWAGSPRWPVPSQCYTGLKNQRHTPWLTPEELWAPQHDTQDHAALEALRNQHRLQGFIGKTSPSRVVGALHACVLSHFSHIRFFATTWTVSSVHGDSPGKDIGVGCHALLQGIFPTQDSNPGFQCYRWMIIIVGWFVGWLSILFPDFYGYTTYILWLFFRAILDSQQNWDKSTEIFHISPCPTHEKSPQLITALTRVVNLLQ